MEILRTIAQARRFVSDSAGKTVGLVPTMGALHRGHLALAEAALAENDLCISSIFVNPAQFNKKEDLVNYPRTFEKDAEMLEKVGCHAIFAPSDSEMYPTASGTRIFFGQTESVMEGEFRPGHFAGVGLIISKLFNILQPTRAYFGEKDRQQVAIVRQLAEDLCFPVEIRACATVRDPDGLALSSRNLRLTEEERRAAPQLFAALQAAASKIAGGATVKEARQTAEETLSRQPLFRADYITIAGKKDLLPAGEDEKPGTNAVILGAAFLGKVRLIDNISVN